MTRSGIYADRVVYSAWIFALVFWVGLTTLARPNWFALLSPNYVKSQWLHEQYIRSERYIYYPRRHTNHHGNNSYALYPLYVATVIDATAPGSDNDRVTFVDDKNEDLHPNSTVTPSEHGKVNIKPTEYVTANAISFDVSQDSQFNAYVGDTNEHLDHLDTELTVQGNLSNDTVNNLPDDGQVSDGVEGNCASVEKMGQLASGNVVESSLRVRRVIEEHLLHNGALHVRNVPAEQFCHRGFVYARATEDGLGNDLYKLLTAFGLSIMLNRSLIIGEHGSANPAYLGLGKQLGVPFGDYLEYSNQTFSMSEVKRLWVTHNCTGRYKRPFVMAIDDFQKPSRTKVLCEDWTTWSHAIIWFKGTTDSNALQFFLKNRHPRMQQLAAALFGDTSKPDSRPNTFGELFKALISPKPIIEEAVQWALGPALAPDLSIHMRMLNSRSGAASYAVSDCLRTVLRNIDKSSDVPLVALVTDTPFIINFIKEQLEGFAQVVHFDYKLFTVANQNLSKVMSNNYFQPPEKRVKDWGSMPRWVAIVDFFLASRAKSGVISGANRRVGTTYSQLVASYAAALRIDEQENHTRFSFYSSFQSSLLAEGLEGQRGWGHTWRRFGGRLSCKKQTRQCAKTPLLPYAWWDGPLQSPVPRDIRRMLGYGVKVSSLGQVEDGSVDKNCKLRKTPVEILQLRLPSCKSLRLCH